MAAKSRWLGGEQNFNWCHFVAYYAYNENMDSNFEKLVPSRLFYRYKNLSYGWKRLEEVVNAAILSLDIWKGKHG